MTAAEWERIKAIFDAALSVDMRVRDAWLDQACAGTPELRQTIAELLRTYDDSSGADPRDEEEPPVFSPSQVVGNRFTVIRLIARGGMGEVYEARDAALNGLRVALKTVRTAGIQQRLAYERFKREVWVAREISHEGICRIYDLVEHRDTAPDGTERLVPCLTMKLLDGETLGAWLRGKRPLSPSESLPLIRQIAIFPVPSCRHRISAVPSRLKSPAAFARRKTSRAHTAIAARTQIRPFIDEPNSLTGEPLPERTCQECGGMRA